MMTNHGEQSSYIIWNSWLSIGEYHDFHWWSPLVAEVIQSNVVRTMPVYHPWLGMVNISPIYIYLWWWLGYGLWHCFAHITPKEGQFWSLQSPGSPWGASNGTAHALGTLRYVVWVSNAWPACGPIYSDVVGWGSSYILLLVVVGWWWDGMGFRTSGTCCCLFCNFAWHLFPKFFPKQTDDYTTGFVPDYVPSICKAWFIIHGIPPMSTEITGLPWTTDQH